MRVSKDDQKTRRQIEVRGAQSNSTGQNQSQLSECLSEQATDAAVQSGQSGGSPEKSNGSAAAAEMKKRPKSSGVGAQAPSAPATRKPFR